MYFRHRERSLKLKTNNHLRDNLSPRLQVNLGRLDRDLLGLIMYCLGRRNLVLRLLLLWSREGRGLLLLLCLPMMRHIHEGGGGRDSGLDICDHFLLNK